MKSLRIRSYSVFGACPEIYRKRVAHWKHNKELYNHEFLVVDDKDGRLGMCPLRLGVSTTIYEPSHILMYGGKLITPIKNLENNDIVYKEKTTLGLIDRIQLEFLEENADLHNENFYESNNDKKFGYVAACRSFDRDENKDIPIKDKIEKLKKSVKDGGYLYIEYYISLDDNDLEKYPLNSFLRYGEMKEYFNSNDWIVISISEEATQEEINVMNLESKPIILGRIEVRRKKEKIRSEYNKRKPRKITELNKCGVVQINRRKVRSYSINGVIR